MRNDLLLNDPVANPTFDEILSWNDEVFRAWVNAL
jgi:hypothetical protein